MEKTDLLLSSSASDRDWDRHRLHHQRRLRSPDGRGRQMKRTGLLVHSRRDAACIHNTWRDDDDDDAIAAESANLTIEEVLVGKTFREFRAVASIL